MKKLLLTTMIVTAFIFNTQIKAQFSVNLNVNLGGRPNWGLPGNYAGNYYYLPEIDSYYDIPNRQFIYFEGPSWVFASALPNRFRNYDLFNGFKVVINQPKPYLNYGMYRDRYRSYYNTYREPVMIAQNRPGYYNNRYENDRYGNNRPNNNQFNRGNGNQGYDIKRREDGRNNNDNRGRSNERGRENDHGNRRGRG